MTELPSAPDGLDAKEKAEWSAGVKLLAEVGLLEHAIEVGSLAAYVRCFATMAQRNQAP